MFIPVIDACLFVANRACILYETVYFVFFKNLYDLEKEIMPGTMPGARRRGRPRLAWMDSIKTWTGLPVEESVRMTEDRDKWRKYMVWPTLGLRTAKEQNRMLTQYFTPWGINLQMPWVWVNRATTRLAVANGSKDHRSSQR